MLTQLLSRTAFASLFLALLITTSSSAQDADSKIIGRYKCVGTAVSGQKYEGVLTITKFRQAFKLAWHVGQTKYEAVGIAGKHALSAGGKTGNDSWVIVYQLDDDGVPSEGTWTASNSGSLLKETLTKLP